MAVYLTNTNELTSIANAIRTKGGTSANLEYPTDFISAINALQTNAMTEIIVPEQSITTSNESTRIPNFNTGLIAGDQYIFTINNERITATASTQGSSVLLFYDSNLIAEYINNLMYFDVLSSSLYDTYTIKVERILTDCDYIRTIIYSLSSENCDTNLMNNAYYALISLNESLNTSSRYIVTIDGYEYICEGYIGEANWISIGDISTTTTRGAQYLNFPFYISHEQSKQSETYFVVRGTGTHTVKIEELTLLTRGTELTTKTITSNGTYSASNDNADGYSEVTVNISGNAPVLQTKTNITPTASSQTITPDSGYDGLSSVQINAMPLGNGAVTATKGTVSNNAIQITPYSQVTEAGYFPLETYPGTAVTVSASELVSGNKVITQGGTNVDVTNYATASVANGSASGPSTVSGTSATVSTGTNTLTLTKTVSITPTVSAGYVSAGTATNATVTLTGSVTTKAAATITPTTSNQTIAAGTYLTGAQTISGDADLVASNIISTANIFGVQGSVVINKYYTGSSAPSSSLGNNGDIYLQA